MELQDGAELRVRLPEVPLEQDGGWLTWGAGAGHHSGSLATGSVLQAWLAGLSPKQWTESAGLTGQFMVGLKGAQQKPGGHLYP